MKISVVTATYNRAQYLDKLYKSLISNISDDYDIEWLIMDDGSEDNTEEICKAYINNKNIDVKYFKQNNQGKMKAINNLSKFVTGELWIECDSDDYFLDNALKVINEKYKIIRDNNEIYGMVFLRKLNGHQLSGNRFKTENTDTSIFDLYYKQGITGEKLITYKTEIRKMHRYELEAEERFVTEARLHHKLDLNYKVRCYNDIVMDGDYQEDGYTKNIKKIFLENPKGYYKFFCELFEHDMRGIKLNKRLYAVKHLILFSYLTKSKIEYDIIKGFYNKLLIFILYLPGRIKSYFYKNNNK